MSFGEKDWQEFGEVEVTLIPFVELHVPNKFVVRGHVLVSDHAVKPTGPELPSDLTSDEVMGEGKGGITWDPSFPMGRRVLRWWGRRGRDYTVSPLVGDGLGEICDRGWEKWWARTEWVSSSGEPGARSECGRRSSGEGRAQPGGR
jgi:hypothetical protein